MPELSTQVPGAYNSSAPPMNVAQYSNWDQIGAAVGDITTGGSLSKSTQADAWYEFATKVGNAAKQLGDVNSKIATEIKAVRESLKGEAGEAFDKYATGLFKKSEELYQTLSGKDYPGNVGGIGHAIRAFAAAWWDTIEKSHQQRAQAAEILKAAANVALLNANSTAEIALITAGLARDVEHTRAQAEDKLISRLRQMLEGLGVQYNNRGQDFTPLRVLTGGSGGGSGSGSGGGSGLSDLQYQNLDSLYQNTYPSGLTTESAGSAGAGQTVQGPLLDPLSPSYQQKAFDPVSTAGGGVGGGSGSGVPGGGAGTGGGGAGGGAPSPAYQAGLDNAKKAIDTLTEGGAGAPSPEYQAGLDDAKKAIDTLGAGSGAGAPSPAYQESLDDAKKAIDGLYGGGAPGGGSGAGTSPARAKALDDAKNAAGKTFDDLIEKADNPAEKKALEDAKEAAEKAIGEIATESGDPAKAREDAQNAAGKVLDDLIAKADDPAAKQALEDAKAAVNEGLGGAEPVDPKLQETYLDAKGDVEKALDDLIAKTDDPAAKEALEDAKQAAGDAIDKLIDPEHHEAVEAAKEDTLKAFDTLAEPGDSAERTQALADAEEAALKAIDGIDTALDPSDPGYQKAIEDAKADTVKAFDALAQPGDSPERTQALADAKAAALKAIDGVDAATTAAADKRAAMNDFLAPGGATGGGVGGGSGGGAGGLSPLGESLALESGGAGGAGGGGTGSGSRFDTQPGQQLGLAAAGSRAQAAPFGSAMAMGPGSEGMPMGGMPMGGMGGAGGGGQEDKQREPQIWMQADNSAWNDDSESPPSSVLGRS